MRLRRNAKRSTTTAVSGLETVEVFADGNLTAVWTIESIVTTTSCGRCGAFASSTTTVRRSRKPEQHGDQPEPNGYHRNDTRD